MKLMEAKEYGTLEKVNKCRNYALRKDKFKVVEVKVEDMQKKPVEKIIPFLKKINGEVVKYSSVCV